MSPRQVFRRQPAALRIAIGLLTVVALAGLLLIGDGLYIKAKATNSSVHLAQISRDASQTLPAANRKDSMPTGVASL